MAFKYERLISWCFQCGKVGHDANRCLHPDEGSKESRPYGEWMRAGNGARTGGPRSIKDSFQWHNPAPMPLTLPRDPRVTANQIVNLLDVTDGTES